MMRKINIFTFLIFVYSVIICLTCKRDFSQDFSKVEKVHPQFILQGNDGHTVISDPKRLEINGSFMARK